MSSRVADQRKRAVKRARTKLLYVRDDDQELWRDLTEMAVALNRPVSHVIASAIREYEPFRAWQAGKETAAQAAADSAA